MLKTSNFKKWICSKIKLSLFTYLLVQKQIDTHYYNICKVTYKCMRIAHIKIISNFCYKSKEPVKLYNLLAVGIRCMYIYTYVPVFRHMSISSVPLKARLEKDIVYVSPQDFFLPPGEHFLGGARNCCSASSSCTTSFRPPSTLRLRYRSGAAFPPCWGYSEDNAARC